VSCIATAFGGGGQQSLDQAAAVSRDASDDDDGDLKYREWLTKYIDGARVVAGTTAGDLRVWSGKASHIEHVTGDESQPQLTHLLAFLVKDILSSLFTAKDGDPADSVTKTALTRLKFSLRGRALAGHRGGVTAIDVPSQVYRPDSIVTGGADGLIKLWSLRSPGSGIRSNSAALDGGEISENQRGRGGDALSVLTGHSGRVACVKTAWHGDRLISGGADRSLRVWDLAAGGKCLNSLVGHTGWVTSLREWGSNTIVSGSTDRTLSLFDARVSKFPLFTLRYHDAPVTDILVGSRTDPIIISASADGSIATWDFRTLSQASDGEPASTHGGSGKVIREPKVSMSHDLSPNLSKPGQVFLCRSAVNPETSFMSIGADTVVREWDVVTGTMESDHSSGFSDMVSGFIPCKTATIHVSDNLSSGFMMSSLDGTVRMRSLQD
jgi:WD40 repeat protein